MEEIALGFSETQAAHVDIFLCSAYSGPKMEVDN